MQRAVRDDRVALEDIAVLCVGRSQGDILRLRDLLHNELTSKLALVKPHRNLIVVGAEDFASKCTKVRGVGRKRKVKGQIVQKKYLTVDSVRRFAGLEAEVSFDSSKVFDTELLDVSNFKVVILLNEDDAEDELQYVGMSRAISKLIIYELCQQL